MRGSYSYLFAVVPMPQLSISRINDTVCRRSLFSRELSTHKERVVARQRVTETKNEQILLWGLLLVWQTFIYSIARRYFQGVMPNIFLLNCPKIFSGSECLYHLLKWVGVMRLFILHNLQLTLIHPWRKWLKRYKKGENCQTYWGTNELSKH